MLRSIAVPVLSVSVLTFVSLLIGGCSQQRPIESIRADADFQFRQAEFGAAESNYLEIVERRPGDWEAQYKRGRCLLELDRPEDAREALQQAYALKPANDDVAEALAEALFRSGQHSELFAFLRQRADDRRDAGAYLAIAMYAMDLDDMDSASTALMTAIEVDEGASVAPYLARAAFAARLGNTVEVIRRLRQAYGINPNDTRVIEKLKEYGEVPGPTIALPPGR